MSIIPTTGSRQWFTLENTSGGTRPYSVSVTETTLYNPRWSTFSGFNTSWGFHNTTNVTLNVTLTVIRTTGEVLATDTFTVTAGRVVFKSATGLGVAADRAGNARLAHDGPPGAIEADGFMVSPDGLTGFPVKFEPVRENAH